MRKKKISKLEIFLIILVIGSATLIYFTIFRMIPVIVMVSALATESKELMVGIPNFIYSWLFLHAVFLISTTGLILKKLLNKKTLKKLKIRK